MRRIFDDLKDRLTAFVDQRDDAALVLSAPDDEALLVATCLGEVDDTRSSELYWIHTEPFEDPTSYVATVVDGFAAKHAAVSLKLEEQGEVPWPELPADLLDGEAHPVERLRSLMGFSRDLLPDPDHARAVWALWPLTVTDRRAWTWLLEHLLPHELPSPWCRRLRIVVRAHPTDPAMYEALASIPRIRRDQARLSQEDMQAALDDEATDDNLPLPRRLLSVLLSANVDYSHGRLEQALRKYRILLRYHTQARDPTMTALVLNGIGEAQRKLGNREQARRCFEQAVEPAAGAERPPIPILLGLTVNLGGMSMEDERWSEAEGYYDAAQMLATLQRDAPTKLAALENLGVCRYMTHQPEAAVETWRAGATVAGELEMPEPRARFLQRLHWYFGHVSDEEAQAEVARELADLRERPSSPPESAT